MIAVEKGGGRVRPLIGLTTYGIAHAEGYTVPAEYVQSVHRADGIPLLLPPVGVDSIRRTMETIQGLILIGGGDIDPARYGGAPHASVYNVDPARDAFECTLAEEALGSRMPILAICRGLQVLNVVLGGTLHRHLPETFGNTIVHRLPERKTTRHDVSVDADAQIATAMGGVRKSVVSWHHQAIDRLGKGLFPVARSDDGVIEAVALEGRPNLLAVQWHPELSAADDPAQQALFNRLVALSVSDRTGSV